MKGRILIEQVQPTVDGGRWPAKATVGVPVRVTAHAFRDGHEPLRVVLRHRPTGERALTEVEMAALGNDEWEAGFTPVVLGRHQFTVAAWSDPFDTWRHRALTFTAATPVEEVELELAEATTLVKERADKARGEDRRLLEASLEKLLQADAPARRRLATALAPHLEAAMAKLHDRSWEEVLRPHLELVVERERASVGAWYEMFPRSEGGLAAAEARLEAIAQMGFDVVYLPPVHPIGVTGRKGPGNVVTAGPGDPGSPWAIGSEDGGHTAIDPGLGTLADFDHFVAAAKRQGLEVALDFAVQFSPDHPWVKEHPDWFQHRADGSIRYAENPPKKYQDIYPPSWEGPHVTEMSEALRDVVLFWVRRGVKVFRVDNPHTKPFPFWAWLIKEVQLEHPDVVFLAEAFTRPRVMRALAKAGFSQSYTYFTWRNTKAELIEYLTELSTDGSAAYMRTNFFANTPDILHAYLQQGGPTAFAVRLVLAATMSPSYGIYSGYELYENLPERRGSEEYVASEKYETRSRRWDQPGSLVPLVRRVNDVRGAVKVFDRIDNVTFCDIDNDEMVAYLKEAAGQAVLVVVNLDPLHWQEATVTVPARRIPGVDPWSYEVRDLLTGERFQWSGDRNYVRLDPSVQPAHILAITV